MGPMLRLALPVMAEESLLLSVGYTDWWLAGHFVTGEAALAAMALMAYLLWLLPSSFSALAIGVTAIVSRRMGEGREVEANRAVHQSMLLGLLLSAVVMTVGFLYSEPFPRWMQLSGESASLTTRYLVYVLAVAPLIMAEQVLASALRAAGDTVTGFIAKSVVVAVNLVVSTGLVTGWGVFPRLGWEGLAIGTAVGHGLGGLILILAWYRGRGGLKWSAAHLVPHPETLRLLLRIGIPGGIDTAALLAFQFAFLAIVNRLGDAAAAAHGLAVQIEALAYMPGSAFQVAAATMTGQLLGAGRPDRAAQAIRHCLIAGIVVMGWGGLAFSYGGEQVAGWFVGPEGVATVASASRLLVIVASAMPALAICLVGSGALRGAGDTRWPLAITLTGFGAIRLPLAIAASLPSELAAGWGWGLGVEGAWWAMVTDLWLRAALVSWRLTRGGWKGITLHREPTESVTRR